MIGFPLGLLYANAGEWVIHKYILHGLGKNRKSFWKFHWHDHHGHARKNEHIDEDYEQSLLGWNGQSKEALGLLLAGVGHLPLLPIAPFFTSAVMYSIWNYYRVHRRSHLEPEWARENLPWHYDHHMAPNQDANWCVTKPWFDHIMGTREVYAGTEREKLDIEKRNALKKRKLEREQKEKANATVGYPLPVDDFAEAIPA